MKLSDALSKAVTYTVVVMGIDALLDFAVEVREQAKWLLTTPVQIKPGPHFGGTESFEVCACMRVHLAREAQTVAELVDDFSASWENDETQAEEQVMTLRNLEHRLIESIRGYVEHRRQRHFDPAICLLGEKKAYDFGDEKHQLSNPVFYVMHKMTSTQSEYLYRMSTSGSY